MIADDVRDLNAALQQFDLEKNKVLGSCYDCVQLAKAYEEVSLLATKLSLDMDAFSKFHGWVKGQLRRVFSSDIYSFTAVNIASAFRECYEFVSDSNEVSHTSCATGILRGEGEAGFPNCCYRQVEGKPVRPMVSTMSTLSEQMRKPFVRLTNDGAYYSQHGESTPMASYHDSREYIRGILPELAAREYEAQCARPASGPRRRGPVPEDAIDWDSPVVGRARSGAIVGNSAFSATPGVATGIAERGYGEATAIGAGISVGTGGAGLGAGVGAQALRPALGMAVTGTLATTAMTGAASAGVGVITGALTAVAETGNFNLEVRALQEEIARGSQADINRMMIALRTINKDGGFFEKCTDEVAK
ncbi:MAG: hypothetical protein ACRELF_26315, partial [Gemmataceae bacterium]